MTILLYLLEYLKQLTILELFIIFLFENILILLLSVVTGFILDKTISKIFQKISKKELFWTNSTLLLNTLITLLGFLSYKYDYLYFNFDATPLRIFIDTFILIMGMDVLMYSFHFLIHHIKFIKKIHDLHHHYENPTAITLYVLNPIEVIGFGLIWLSFITVYPASIIAVMIYLFLNVVMGIIGHVELEIIPDYWSRKMISKWIANTKFHNDHHKNPTVNYGFYTTIWDNVFRTLKKN